MVATALQTARWLIIQELCGDLGQTIDKDNRLDHNDRSIKESVKESNKSFQERFKEHGHRESEKNTSPGSKSSLVALHMTLP